MVVRLSGSSMLPRLQQSINVALTRLVTPSGIVTVRRFLHSPNNPASRTVIPLGIISDLSSPQSMKAPLPMLSIRSGRRISARLLPLNAPSPIRKTLSGTVYVSPAFAAG